MPNQPKTPHRSFRLNDETYYAIVEIAEREGRTITDVVREALDKFIQDHNQH